MKKLVAFLFILSLLSINVFGQSSINELVVLEYGDGVAEDAFAWAQAGGKCAVKFHPWLPGWGYPFRIVGGSVWIHPDFPNGQIIGSSFQIDVYDDDGIDGYPNKLLGSMDCIVDSTGWYEFYGLDIIIDEGMFYIAMVQTDLPPDCAGLGIDSWGFHYYDMSYLQVPDNTEWEFSIYQNFMIRAFIDYSVSVNENHIAQTVIKAYPNPFTTSTTIEYELKDISNIQFTIYNVIGEVVYATEDRLMPQGSHAVTWSPRHLPEGMYYAVLRSEEGVSVVKMVKQ